MKINYFLIAGLSMVLLGCNNKPEHKHPITTQQTGGSPYGAVATAHPLATLAAIRVLEEGGNAADAAIAASYVLSVTEPSMSGLGGRMQAVIAYPNGTVKGIDATTQAPMEYDPQTAPKASDGYPVAGIPGLVRGLAKLRKEHGTLPLDRLIADAIALADTGFAILPGESERQSSAVKAMALYPGTFSIFIKPDTTVFRTGERLIQKDLAKTLKAIATLGEDEFYSGEIGRRMAEDLSANGSMVTWESIKAYEAKDAPVLISEYKGHRVHALWMPSYGAITLEYLELIERLLPETSLTDEVAWANAHILAHKRAYEDRSKQVYEQINTSLFSDDYIDSIAVTLKQDFNVSSSDTSISEGHTTHFSIVDKDGMMVALTQSLGPVMGSKLVTPGLGFVYASTLGGYLGDMVPGERASSHISPVVVLKDGKPVMALGAAGGGRIIPAVVQVLSRHIDMGMEIPTALSAGRLYASDSSIYFESHEGVIWAPGTEAALLSKGIPVEVQQGRGRFGRVHMIWFENGSWNAAADPDWEGTADSPHIF